VRKSAKEKRRIKFGKARANPANPINIPPKNRIHTNPAREDMMTKHRRAAKKIPQSAISEKKRPATDWNAKKSHLAQMNGPCTPTPNRSQKSRKKKKKMEVRPYLPRSHSAASMRKSGVTKSQTMGKFELKEGMKRTDHEPGCRIE